MAQNSPQANFTQPSKPSVTQTTARTAPATRPPTAPRQSPPASTQAKARHHKHVAKKVAAKTTTTQPEPEDQDSATDVQGEQEDHQKAAPAVVLVGGAADRVHAEKIVQSAVQKLSKISRDSLKGENVAEYDQIQGFVSAARHALDEQNYELAFALASKAESLTERLNQKNP